MRKFEINVPHDVLPDVTRAIHGQGFTFSVASTSDEEIVKIEVPYDKDTGDEINDLEEEVNDIVEQYYEEEKEENR